MLYRVYEILPFVPILSQINPVHALTIDFLKTCFSILPSVRSYSKWSPSVRFYHQNPLCTSALLHACHMLSPSNSSSCGHCNIWRGVKITQPLFMQLSPLHCYLVPLGSTYLLQHPISQHHESTFFYNASVL